MKAFLSFVFLFNFILAQAQQIQVASDTAKARAFKDQAFNLRRVGQNDEAIPLYDSSMFYYKKVDSLRLYFDAWVGQIWCHINKGDFATAEEASKAGAEEASKAGNEVYTNKFVRQTAVVYASRSEFEKAATEFLRILESHRKKYGEEHVAYAQALSDVSLIYDRMGESSKALGLRLESIAILEKLDDRWRLARGYQNLGALYSKFGDYRKLLEYSEKALSMAKTEYGEESPAVAAILENMGVAYWNLGQMNKAKEHYLQTLRMRQKLLGDQHWQLGNTYQNLASISQTEGDQQASIDYSLKAYEIRLSALGSEHPRTIESLREIGNVYLHNEQYGDAEKYIKQAVHLFQQKYDSVHADVALALMSLGAAKVSR